jgi:hypothetical protein
MSYGNVFLMPQSIDLLCVDWWEMQMGLVVDHDEKSDNHSKDVMITKLEL